MKERASTIDVAAIMRDELPNALEWLAPHSLLGFNDVLVGTTTMFRRRFGLV